MQFFGADAVASLQHLAAVAPADARDAIRPTVRHLLPALLKPREPLTMQETLAALAALDALHFSSTPVLLQLLQHLEHLTRSTNSGCSPSGALVQVLCRLPAMLPASAAALLAKASSGEHAAATPQAPLPDDVDAPDLSDDGAEFSGAEGHAPRQVAQALRRVTFKIAQGIALMPPEQAPLVSAQDRPAREAALVACARRVRCCQHCLYARCATCILLARPCKSCILQRSLQRRAKRGACA